MALPFVITTGSAHRSDSNPPEAPPAAPRQSRRTDFEDDMEVFADSDEFGDKVKKDLAEAWGFEVSATGGYCSSYKCKSVKGCTFYVKAFRPVKGVQELEIDYSKSVFKHTHVLTKVEKKKRHARGRPVVQKKVPTKKRILPKRRQKEPEKEVEEEEQEIDERPVKKQKTGPSWDFEKQTALASFLDKLVPDLFAGLEQVFLAVGVDLSVLKSLNTVEEVKLVKDELRNARFGDKNLSGMKLKIFGREMKEWVKKKGTPEED